MIPVCGQERKPLLFIPSLNKLICSVTFIIIFMAVTHKSILLVPTAFVIQNKSNIKPQTKIMLFKLTQNLKVF